MTGSVAGLGSAKLGGSPGPIKPASGLRGGHDGILEGLGTTWWWPYWGWVALGQVALPREGEEAAALPAQLPAAMLQSRLSLAAVQAPRAPGECQTPPPQPHNSHPYTSYYIGTPGGAPRCRALWGRNFIFWLEILQIQASP